jgi:hypothetical protein
MDTPGVALLGFGRLVHPIRMNAVAESEVRAIVAAAGGRMLAVRPSAHAAPVMASRLYFVTRAVDVPGESVTDPHAGTAAYRASAPAIPEAS